MGSGVYVGFDPTADSLHIGNLLAILSLLHFRSHGYKPIAVVSTSCVNCPIFLLRTFNLRNPYHLIAILVLSGMGI